MAATQQKSYFGTLGSSQSFSKTIQDSFVDPVGSFDFVSSKTKAKKDPFAFDSDKFPMINPKNRKEK